MLFNIFWFSILCFSHLFANDKLLSVEMLKILIEIQNNKRKKEEDQDLGLLLRILFFTFEVCVVFQFLTWCLLYCRLSKF